MILDLYELKKNKIKIIIFILFLPLTFFFLIENLIIYIISLWCYILIFTLKYIKYKIFKKKTKKMIFINRFKFLKNDFLIFFKNIFLEYPKSRAFFNFYNIGKLINKKGEKENRKEIIKDILKTIFNRYLILLITGLPYLIIFCNIWFVNKFFFIFKLKQKEKAKLIDFIFVLVLNLNRDLMPLFKIYVKKMKIKFNNKKVIFNPTKDLKKIILDLAKEKKLEKQILNIKKDSIITFVKNIENINKENNQQKWSNRHIESIIFLNEKETVSTNETSKPYIFNKIDKKEIENIYYGGCSYKNGNCYITKPIVSKIEYKNLIKDSINHKIKNIDYDKANYNQILAILFGLKNGYLEAKYIEKNNNIEFFYKENRENLLNLIRSNKQFIKNSTYESIENSNEFFEKIKELEKNLEIKNKIMLTHQSISYNLVNSNQNLYQLLKLK